MGSSGWLIPEPIEGNETVCLKMQVPDNVRYIAAVVGAIYQTGKWFNWEKSGEPGDDRAARTAAVMRKLILDTLTVDGCDVELSQFEQDRSSDVLNGIGDLSDLIDLEKGLEMKYRIDGELYEPVIDLVKCGCGSGSGGDGADDGGGAIPGGSPGGNYEGLTRVIDICANVTEIFLDQIGDWVNEAQQLQYVPGLSLISEEFEGFVGVSLQELDSFEGEIDSDEFKEAFKRWSVVRLDDPFPGFQNREQLRTEVARLPILVAGTLFMPVVRVWAEVANLDRLNASIERAKGTASLNGECAALQRSFGREPFQPNPGEANTVQTIEYPSGDLRAYRFVINKNIVGETLPLVGIPSGETIVTGASYNCYQTGQPGGFAFQAVRYLDDTTGNQEELFRTTAENSGTTGIWYEHTVTDPSVQPFIDQLYNDFGNGGQREVTAYSDPPGTSAGAGLPSDTDLQVWDNPTPPASSPGTWAGEFFIITSF